MNDKLQKRPHAGVVCAAACTKHRLLARVCVYVGDTSGASAASSAASSSSAKCSGGSTCACASCSMRSQRARCYHCARYRKTFVARRAPAACFGEGGLTGSAAAARRCAAAGCTCGTRTRMLTRRSRRQTRRRCRPRRACRPLSTMCAAAPEAAPAETARLCGARQRTMQHTPCTPARTRRRLDDAQRHKPVPERCAVAAARLRLEGDGLHVTNILRILVKYGEDDAHKPLVKLLVLSLRTHVCGCIVASVIVTRRRQAHAARSSRTHC